MEKREKTRGYSERLAAISTFVCEVIYGGLVLYTDVFHTTKGDMLYYVSALVIAFVSFVVFKRLFDKLLKWKDTENQVRETITEVLVLLIILVGITVSFIFPYIADKISGYYLGGQNVNTVRLVTIGVTGILTLIVTFAWKKKQLYSEKKIHLWVFYFLLAEIAGFYVYQPNCFESDLYHFDAYWNSVYRALQFAPYSSINTGVYGFYGIIVAPIVRVFGGSFENFVLLYAVLTVLSVLCYCYVLEHMVKSTCLKVLGSIGIIAFVVWGRGSIYLQVFPHRILWSGLLLAFMIWWKERKESNWLYSVISMILISLALVWNFESGMACLLAWVGSNIVDCLQKTSTISKNVCLRLVKILSMMPVTLFIAYNIIGLYNVLAGGKYLSLKECLFPFVGTANSYMDFLVVALPKSFSPWMLCMLVLFLCVILVLRTTILCGRGREDKKIVWLAACTIVVIVQMAYYVNRSTPLLLFIVLPGLSVILPYLVEYITDKVYGANRLADGMLRAFITATVVSMLAVAIMFLVSVVPEFSGWRKTREMQKFYELAERIEQTVSKDTVGVGIGVSEIYSYLGWDTQFYALDIPDWQSLSDEQREECREILYNADSLLINSDDWWQISEKDGGTPLYDYYMEEYVCVGQFLYEGELGIRDYRYYIKK